MPKSNQPKAPEGWRQVPARPHDSGSAANETVDGLDATAEALRHAAEDTSPSARQHRSNITRCQNNKGTDKTDANSQE